MNDAFFRLSEHVQHLLISFGFAGVCGALSYMLKVEEGKPFKWGEFFLHTAISAVFGLISFEIFAYEGFPPAFAGAMSGVSGWLGTRVARIAEVIIRKKLGLTKEDLK